MKEKFDPDRFVDSYEDDTPIFGVTEVNHLDQEAVCPNCGSESYEKLKTTKRGRVIGCTDCE